MKPNLRMAIILPVFSLCVQHAFSPVNPYAKIKDIPLPDGYTRIPYPKNSFSAWLRTLSLKKNKTVYLYNGIPKTNQSAQFAVINISVGTSGLQQCADAVMRLRAEYLYAQQRFSEIVFTDNQRKAYRLGNHADRKHFDKYLEQVFTKCGSASLEKQLSAAGKNYKPQPGDVLIQGGSPGHAMMVVDAAADQTGSVIFLLAQSYMPAQDVHIVINPAAKKLSPWYEWKEANVITPEWIFGKGHFKKW